MIRGYHPRVRRLGIVLGVAGVLAIATTRGSVHIPPTWEALMVAAAAIVASLLVPERWRRPAAIGAAIVAALASAHVLFRAGLPQVHDPDHMWGLWAYARAVRAGHPLPTWIPWIGAGMPLLGFYGPVSFLSSLPGVLLGLAPVGIWKLTMAQASVLAALGALAGARLLGASWRGSAIAACALALSPWRLTVVDYRGALGEAVAFAWAPVVAAAAIAMCRAPSRRMAAWLTGSVALLIPTHLITTFCLGVVLVPVLLIDALAVRGGGFVRRFGLAVGSAALGAGLVAAWCVPALTESGATTLPMQTRENTYFVYAQHGLSVPDVTVRRAWDRLRPSLLRRDRAAGGEGEQMPFYAGSVVLALGLTAPWWSRSRRTWGLAAGTGIALAMALAPVADVVTHLPLVDHVQFPWRFLSAAAVLGALSAGVGIGSIVDDAPLSWRAALPALAVPVLLFLDAAPYTGAAGWIPPYRGVTHWARVPGSDPTGPFDATRRAVPVEFPPGAMVRVGDLDLPPDTTATPVELGWIAYVEWTTPAFYRPLLNSRGPEDFGEAGISRFFVADRERPIEIPARPYATLNGVDAGPFTRGVGRIELRPSVPEGGAQLVVREQAFPGWKARVDGREAAIGTGALGFMTLELPAGSHEVVLDYTQGTPARRIGLAISALSLGLGVWLRSSSRRGSRRSS
jgi:hypothetical protein